MRSVTWRKPFLLFYCIIICMIILSSSSRVIKRTRSQAVARIADRTASQQTLVIIAIELIGLAYYECISLI